ncbi:MAG TPA: hypothetical protein VF950_18510 [Planctomycetota bacterium]
MRTTAALALVLAGLVGCSASAAPPPPVAGPKPAARAEGTVYTGAPEGSGALASCDALGRWEAGSGVIEHWIYEPETKRRVAPGDVGRSLTLFRGSLPFPYFSWQPSDLQINQLVYPVGRGFAAMYHVMNHGENAKDCRLFVGLAGDAKKPDLAASEPMSSSKEGDGGRPALAFDLNIAPGSSKFVFVTTPDLRGQVPQDALDLAAEAWERKLSAHRVGVPDKALMTSYFADLAGASLGIAGCADGVAKVEARLAKRQGDALRLIPDVPEGWLTDTIEAVGVPTDFGPLTFKHEGAFNTPAWDLGDACKPPGGFLIPIPGSLKVTVDGKPAEAKDGILKVPAGAKRIETVR